MMTAGSVTTRAVATPRAVVTPPGRPVDDWRPLIEAAPRVRLGQLRKRFGIAQGAPLVVFAAHPDDETIGCGRLIAEWTGRIGPVIAVLSTLGEACVDHVAERPDDLAGRRLQEWRSAMTRLGVSGRIVLDLADGRLAEDHHRLRAGVEQVMDQLDRSDQRPLLLAPYRHDPHPDHGAVAAEVVRSGRRHRWPVLQYPIWMTYWLDPASLDARLERLAVGPAAEQARAEALACFTSQLEPLSTELTAVVPPAMLAHHTHQLLLTDRRQ